VEWRSSGTPATDSGSYLILSAHLDMDDDEAYILLLLSDSNLPTGSFVASSGLESYVKHGFASSPDSGTINFVRDSLASYARSALPFVSDAHRAVSGLNLPGSDDKSHSVVVDSLSVLDDLYDTMTLNHVAKRASKSQGIALLSLYSKGFSQPSSLSAFLDKDMESHQSRMKDLFEGFKLRVRREEGHGHLPVCWGALTAALGLTLGMQTRNTYLGPL
jgi:urease accessory protein